MDLLELDQLGRLGSGYCPNNSVELREKSLSYAQSNASVQVGSANLPEESVWIIKPGCSGDDNHRSAHF